MESATGQRNKLAEAFPAVPCEEFNPHFNQSASREEPEVPGAAGVQAAVLQISLGFLNYRWRSVEGLYYLQHRRHVLSDVQLFSQGKPRYSTEKASPLISRVANHKMPADRKPQGNIRGGSVKSELIVGIMGEISSNLWWPRTHWCEETGDSLSYWPTRQTNPGRYAVNNPVTKRRRVLD
ncbi:hypothetical protein Bbelb_006560 [Branchiostoma belcheri]|nr:hypothetical protein Bbelb_006560 [Branchiostoma belcheri]